MLYTLYYQPQTSSDYVIAVATSNYLLKLFKIKKMTFPYDDSSSYIVRTKESNKYVYHYGYACLSRACYADFMKFSEAVDGGKYFKSYDYRQRVIELLNRRA